MDACRGLRISARQFRAIENLCILIFLWQHQNFINFDCFDMNLEHFAQMRALECAYVSTNQTLVDIVLADAETAKNLPLKRIQFDAWEGMVDELESVCALLDCSKRQFLEGAVSDAITRAKATYFSTLDKVAADLSGVQLTLVEA